MSVRDTLERAAIHWSWGKLSLGLLASLAMGALGLTWATILYVESGFPPGLIPGQLAFSAESFRSWYAVLLEKGTLPVYVRTQYVYFLFIFGLLATLFFFHLMMAKAQLSTGWRRLALNLAVLGPAIAASDAVENIVTLTMQASPTNFPPFLAYLVSTLSAIKWAWAAIGCTLICIQLIALAWFRLGSKSGRSSS